MKAADPLDEYRVALINRLAAQPAALVDLAERVPEAEWHRLLVVDNRTLHQMAAHIRDAVALAFYPRVERILTEESPHLEPFPYHYWSIEHGYQSDEPLRAIVDALAATYESLVDRLRAMSTEDWARIGFHPPSGPRTVLWWSERIHGHTAVHLDDLRRALST